MTPKETQHILRAAFAAASLPPPHPQALEDFASVACELPPDVAQRIAAATAAALSGDIDYAKRQKDMSQ